MRAFAGESDCERMADAARAAGDKRDAIGKGFGHSVLLLLSVHRWLLS
jgi:hypothetical protein